MGNCLSKKMKNVVNNDSLNEPGYFFIKAHAADSFVASQRKVDVGSRATVTLEIISTDGYFTDNQGNRLSNSTTGFSEDGRMFTYKFGVTQTVTYLSNHDIKVKVSKYKLNSIQIGKKISCDLSQLSYAGIEQEFFGIAYSSEDWENIEVLKHVPIGRFSNYGNNRLYGDVGKLTLSAANGATVFDINNSACTGNLTIPAGRLGVMNIYNTAVELDIDSMPITGLTAFNARNAHNVRGNCNTIFSKIDNKAADTLYLEGTQCTGELETMLESIYSVTRTKDSMLISLANEMTFNGAHVAPTLKVLFSSNEIIVKINYSQEEIGRYNGTTWTYSS